MFSNDTSTFLRAFPHRKAWHKAYQYNFKGNRLTSYGTKGVVITLWNLTKKYEVALKTKDIIPIKEAEIDREEVADAYRVLETPWERTLDGRFYQTIAIMQHHRDSQLAAPEIAPEEWIEYFANEVKRRSTPLLFLVSPEQSIPPFNLPQADEPVTMAKAPTQDDKLAIRRHQVSFVELAIEALNDRRNAIRKKLQGKQIKYTELPELLTNWELDLLSQMIRDNEIPATFNKTWINFHQKSHSKKTGSDFTAVAIAATKYEEVQ